MNIQITIKHEEIIALIMDAVEKQGMAPSKIVFKVSTDRPTDPVLVDAIVTAIPSKPKPAGPIYRGMAEGNSIER